jgi:hypothetical protein
MKMLCPFVLLLAATVVHAQNQGVGGCPPGEIPYSGTDLSSCGPIPNGYNSQPSQQQQPQAPHTPPQVWADYWGAISTDTPKGLLGASAHASSQANAEQAAVADCRSKGGTQCTLQVSFRNGCGAMVIGDKVFNVNSASTLDGAIQKGMALCTKASSNCHVYYSTCSLPSRIQ